MDTRSALASLAPVLLAEGAARRRGLKELQEAPFVEILHEELRVALLEAFAPAVGAEAAIERLAASHSAEVRAAGEILRWAHQSRELAAASARQHVRVT